VGVFYIKVREALNNPTSVTGIAGREDRKVTDSRETSFHSELKRVEDRTVEERIRELVEKISEQGRKLAGKVDIRELKIYKKLISDFLDEAVSNSHEFFKRNMLDRRGRHKVYAIVKKVNEELEGLTKDVLSAEKDNIRVLQRLDDIRGMILDIVM
jgi:uncharacterized protein